MGIYYYLMCKLNITSLFELRSPPFFFDNSQILMLLKWVRGLGRLKAARLSAQCQQLVQRDEGLVLEVARLRSCLDAQGIALEAAYARTAELVPWSELAEARANADALRREAAAARAEAVDLERCRSAQQNRMTRARAEVEALQAALEV